MKGHVAREDVEQWGPLVTWLTGASDSTLSPRGPPAAGPRKRPGAAAGEPAPGEAPQAGPAEAPDDAAAEHAVTQDALAGDAAADQAQDDAAGAELPPRAIAAQA
jgi:hypothetical protein